MKNNNQIDIKTARDHRSDKAAVTTDILVIPEVVENNVQRLAQHPRPKRRRNYIKKIQNDSFLFSV